jgi:hypothetical protein
MAEFDSPLGRKQFATQSRKVFNVEDTNSAEKNFMPELEVGVPIELTPAQFQEMQQRRNSFKQTQSRPTSESRQRIELLTGIGRLTKEVTIEGHLFTLQSLKSKEMRETIRAVSQASDGPDSIFEMRAQILARSIVKIDNHPVAVVLGSDSVEARLSFIDDSEEQVVNQLYSAYTEMTKKVDLAVKNDADVQEVVEEIKK